MKSLEDKIAQVQSHGLMGHRIANSNSIGLRSFRMLQQAVASWRLPTAVAGKGCSLHHVGREEFRRVAHTNQKQTITIVRSRQMDWPWSSMQWRIRVFIDAHDAIELYLLGRWSEHRGGSHASLIRLICFIGCDRHGPIVLNMFEPLDMLSSACLVAHLGSWCAPTKASCRTVLTVGSGGFTWVLNAMSLALQTSYSAPNLHSVMFVKPSQSLSKSVSHLVM